jgi:hypothetical protein
MIKGIWNKQEAQFFKRHLHAKSHLLLNIFVISNAVRILACHYIAKYVLEAVRRSPSVIKSTSLEHGNKGKGKKRTEKCVPKRRVLLSVT